VQGSRTVEKRGPGGELIVIACQKRTSWTLKKHRRERKNNRVPKNSQGIQKHPTSMAKKTSERGEWWKKGKKESNNLKTEVSVKVLARKGLTTKSPPLGKKSKSYEKKD